MPYTYLEDIATADVAFEATGRDLAELFRDAADAQLATMIDCLDSVEPRVEKTIELEHSEPDLLLFDLLQELIFYKDAERLLLRIDRVRVRQGKGAVSLRAVAKGEMLDPERHEQCADVKAVTLHQFVVERTAHGWRCQVILDV